MSRCFTVAGCQFDFVKKSFFKRFNIQKKKNKIKKVFVTKKSFWGGGGQMDKFSMPEKGIFTACILK